jgi:hypothetical protein
VKIPEKFQLMGHPWTVEHIHGKITADDGDQCNGLCEFYKLTIKVNVDNPPSLVLHTFFHEVMHAVLWTLGNDLAENENFVDAVGGGLAQVLASSGTRE